VASVPLHDRASGSVYDPATGEVYVSLYQENIVVILSGTTVVGQVLVGLGAAQMVYDPANGYVYVLDQITSQVSILSGSTLVGTINTLEYGVQLPTGITYDAANSLVYVAGFLDPYILEISGTSVQVAFGAPAEEAGVIQYDPASGDVYTMNASGVAFLISGSSYVGQFSTGGDLPSYATFDPGNGYVYVMNDGSNPSTLAVLSGSGLVALLTVGNSAQAGAYDSANGLLYVPNLDSSTLSIVSGASLIGDLSASVPSSITYDPQSGGLYVGTASAGTSYETIYATELSLGSGQGHSARPTLTSSGSIPVGGTPVASAYDPSNGDLYVANSGTNNVTVLSGDHAVGSVPVGSNPNGATFDTANGNVYVANYGSDNVSLISGTSPVGQVGVGEGPSSAAYDPVTGEVYVANSLSNNVSVISGSVVVASVNVGTYPFGLAYDAQNGEIYVANEGSGNVTVISGNLAVANLPAGTEPYAVAFDPGNGDIYVANVGSDTVSLFNGTQAFGSVSVGSGPDGLAYDPVTGAMVVADFSSDNLSVIFGSDLVETLPGGSGPSGLSSEPATGTLWVADTHSDSLGVWNSSVALSSALAGSADVGEWLALVTPVIYAYPPGLSLSAATTPGAGLTCLPILPSPEQLTTLCRAEANGTYEVTTGAADPFGQAVSSTTPVTVYRDLSPVTVTANRLSADVGQMFDFSAVVSGGAPGALGYVWSSPASLGCSSPTQALLVCSPTAPVTQGPVAVEVTDANGVSTSSTPLLVTVYPDPTLSLPVAAPTAVDVGQTVALSVSVTNASGDAVTVEWRGLPPGCSSTDHVTLPCTPSAPGIYSLSVELTDANGFTVSSGALALVVSPTLGTPLLTPSVPILDLGQSVAITASVAGGEAPYTYLWSGLPTGCPAGNTSVIACRPTSAGNYSITVQVRDANDLSSSSRALTLTVYPTLLAQGLGLSPASMDLGESTQISVLTSGGSGGLTYRWFGLPAGCAGDSGSSAVTCRPSAVGSYEIGVTVTDAAGGTVTVGPSPLYVAEPLATPELVPSATSASAGTLVVFSANETGGVGPYTYEWTGLPVGCPAPSSPTLGCLFSDPGNYNISVTVADSTGAHEASPALRVVVSAAKVPTTSTSPNSTSPASSTSVYTWIAVAIAVIAVVLAAYAIGRPPRGKTPAPSRPEDGKGRTSGTGSEGELSSQEERTSAEADSSSPGTG
jgi:YVTN family beta-propeller protein